MTGLRTLLASLLGLVALTAAQEAPGAGLIFECRCVTCHRPGGMGGVGGRYRFATR